MYCGGADSRFRDSKIYKIIIFKTIFFSSFFLFLYLLIQNKYKNSTKQIKNRGHFNKGCEMKTNKLFIKIWWNMHTVHAWYVIV